MSRKVRFSFAAPLVVTLAVVPACVVRTSSNPPPASGTGTATSGSGGKHVNPPRPGTGASTSTTVHTNPPRPPTVDPNPATPGQATNPGGPRAPVVIDTVQQPPPVAPAKLATWSVFLNRVDKACYARLEVACPDKPATCNPPPPRKLAECPPGFKVDDVDRPLKIVEHTAGDCYLHAPMPACPSGMACNPPAPHKTTCPK